MALDPLHAVMGSPRMSVPSLAHSEHACTAYTLFPLLHTKVIWPYSQLLRQGMRSCTPGFLKFRPDYCATQLLVYCSLCSSCYSNTHSIHCC